MALKVSNLEGNELADGYIRTSNPQSRWSDTWDVVKSSFLKLVLLNVFVLITFIPVIVIVLFRNWYISGMGVIYPFNQSVLYPFYPDTVGLTEKLYLSCDLYFYGALIVAGLIASLGVSGAAYSIRKLINTHGEYKVKDFFHGIKVCYLNTVLPVTVFILFMFSTLICGDWMHLVIATGGNSAGAITAYVFIIIATVLAGIFCGWLLAVGTGYRVNAGDLFKNTFVMMKGSILLTVLMAAFSLIPVWLYMIGGFFRVIAYVLFLLFGFSFILISWTAFTQRVFDAYVEPSVKTVKDSPTKSEKQIAADSEDDGKRRVRELLAAGRSELIARPVMPVPDTASAVALGKTFSRADIAAVKAQRENIVAEVTAYEKAHENEPAYTEYNKLFADRDKALQTETDKKGKKKKKISSDNLLK